MPKVEVYSSKFCPFSAGAERLLSAKGVEFVVFYVDEDPSKREEMTRRGGGDTVPQIFVDDRPIGGFDDLQVLDLEDALDPLLGL